MSIYTSARIIAAAVLLGSGVAGAVPPPPETSLNTCQSTVRTAAKTYLTNYVNAVGSCLQSIASKVVLTLPDLWPLDTEVGLR